MNVQVVNGEGKTASVNGEGNLVIGYDEDAAGNRPARTTWCWAKNRLHELRRVLAGVDNRTLEPPF